MHYMECSIPSGAGDKAELKILQYLQVREAENTKWNLSAKPVPLKSVVQNLW